MKRPTQLVLSVLLLLNLMLASPISAQVPETLNYQGCLTQSSGAPLVEGEVVQFAIYTTETGGTPIWSELQSIFPEATLQLTKLS